MHIQLLMSTHPSGLLTGHGYQRCLRPTDQARTAQRRTPACTGWSRCLPVRSLVSIAWLRFSKSGQSSPAFLPASLIRQSADPGLLAQSRIRKQTSHKAKRICPMALARFLHLSPMVIIEIPFGTENLSGKQGQCSQQVSMRQPMTRKPTK